MESDIAPDGVADDVAKSIVFKKREVKGNLRNRPSKASASIYIKREEDDGQDVKEDEEEDENDIGISARALEEVRFEQEMRRRKSGIDATTTNRGKDKEKDKSDLPAQSAITSGNSVLKQREFTYGTVQSGDNDNDNDQSKPVRHEAIRDAYVQTKLLAESQAKTGQVETNSTGNILSSSSSSTDDLYKLSADLQLPVQSSSKLAIDHKQADVDVGIYSGITEVLLPSSYSIRNAQDTERSKKRLAEEGGVKRYDSNGMRIHLGYRNMEGGYNGKSDRFAKPISHREWIQNEEKQSQNVGDGVGVPRVPLPGHESVPIVGGGGGGKRSGNGNGRGDGVQQRGNVNTGGAAADNRMMDEYRKRMRR